MADHWVQFEQANHIPANTHPHPAPGLHPLHGQNPLVAGDDLQVVHWEVVPQPVQNVVMQVQGQMQYPRHIDASNYNAGHYHPPPPPVYPEGPQVPMPWDVGVAEAVPAQAPPFAPEVQENHDGLHGYGAHPPAADPPNAFPGVWPHPAPPADMPPADGLRILAGRFLNNPDTLVNMLRIEPGPGGRFEVWIALELADIFRL